MLAHLKSWWHVHLSWVVAVVTFLTPSVSQFLSQHPKMTGVALLWSAILAILPSPVRPPIVD